MNPDPIKLSFIFLGAACTSLGFGGTLLYLAWLGFRDGFYPLTSTYDLKGWPARIAATLVGLFGLLAVICGLGTLVFGFIRVRQLL